MSGVIVTIARSAACVSLMTAAHIGCKSRSASEVTETQPVSTRKTLAPVSVRTAASTPAVRPAAPPQPAPAANTANLVDVPAGSLKINGNRIAVDAFAIDRTEVTVGAYARCVSEKRCSPAAQDDDACNWAKRKTKVEHPINCVTVKQAQSYCEWNHQRLPTTAEWQLAAGGPEGREYPWGAAHPSNTWVTEVAIGQDYAPGPARHNLCWIGDGTAPDEKYPTGTCVVGSFSAGNTPSGISDLAGNVWEWTGNPQKQPHGTIRYALKGGGYDYDPLGRLEVAVADELLHDDEHYASDVGFRCITPRTTRRPK
jgi:formylglycine-generating enzyme